MSNLERFELYARLLTHVLAIVGSGQIGVWIGKAILRRDGWYEQTKWVRRDSQSCDLELDEL